MRKLTLQLIGAMAAFATGLLATTIQMQVPMAIPASQQGTGGYSVFLQPESGFLNGQKNTCSGSGGQASAAGCDINVNSTTGAYAQGDAVGYTDASGLHALAIANTAGYAISTVEGIAVFQDTVTNNSGQDAWLTFSFEVDATLLADSLARANLGVAFSVNSFGLCPLSNGWTYGCKPTQDWIYSVTNDSMSINQAYATTAVYLAPGTSTKFLFGLDAEVIASYSGLTSSSHAETNAANTLAITGFAAVDQYNNPLSAANFTSAAGANYSSIDASSTPEPVTFVLAGGGLLIVGSCRRRSFFRPQAL